MVQKEQTHCAMDCQTTNVVYRLKCKRCPPWVYIGETSRRLTDRLAEHRGYISRKMNNAIGQHFNQKGHQITDLEAIPIERVFPTDCALTRKRREKYWISQYDSVAFGANIRE